MADKIPQTKLKGTKFYDEAGKDLKPIWGLVRNAESDIHHLGEESEYIQEPGKPDRGFSMVGLAKNGEPLHVQYKDLLHILRTLQVEDVAPYTVTTPEENTIATGTPEIMTTKITPEEKISTAGMNIQLPDWLERDTIVDKDVIRRLRDEGYSPIDIQDIINRLSGSDDFSGIPAFDNEDEDEPISAIPIPSTGFADKIAREFIRSPGTHISDNRYKTIASAVQRKY